MTQQSSPDIIQNNQAILDTIIQPIISKKSKTIYCFDESMLSTRESRDGLKILRYLRQNIGSRHLFCEKSVKDNLEPDEREGLQFLEDLLVDEKSIDDPGASPCMITRNINLAEFLGQRVGENRIFILNKRGQLRSWKEERSENMLRTVEELGNTLVDNKCWLSSSVLRASRITRFVEALEKSQETTRSHVLVLDKSISKACRKNESVSETLNKLTSLCAYQQIQNAMPEAREAELLALAISYADKGSTLLTVWNAAAQAEKVWNLVEATPGGANRLRNVAFCELTWYGKLVPLRNFNKNQLAQELLISTAQGTASSPTYERPREATLLSVANYLGVDRQTLKEELSIFERRIVANDLLALSQKQLNFICQKFAQPKPDETLLRAIGPKLGKSIAKHQMEEIRAIIDHDSPKRELAIIYARRWQKEDILQVLLDESEYLSPYCFNNWFKRSQNTEHNMSLEDLLLSNTYYNLLIQVIDKSLHLSNADDAIAKLQLLQRSAIVAEVRKRAGAILESAAAKGAVISSPGSEA